MTRLQMIESAARELLGDIARRYPGEALRCEFMRALESAVQSAPTPRDLVYAAIDTERDYQTRVWRENAGLEPTAPVRTVAEEAYMLEEYVGKARAAWTVAPRVTEVAVTVDILRKCAGICVRAMENHGAPKRAKS